jgi:cation:H+ antiporter
MRTVTLRLWTRRDFPHSVCDAGRPMSVLAVVSLVVGIAVLIGGAEFLVRGASRLAARTGISSIVIGLTVVAFGTSAPELAVSLQSAFQDNADLAVGNIVGSNIANVLLVLGLAAAVGGGLVVAQRIVRIDVPLMVAISVVVWLMALDGEINRFDGIILALVLTAYVVWTVRAARRPDPKSEAEYDEALNPEQLAQSPVLVDLGLVLGGLIGLVLGARLLVDGASDIAADLGVPDLVIGLTVVAVGTSMPEIATSILAAIRGERDLAVGNAVGSNLFNLMCVLGLSSVISPSAIAVSESARSVDIPIMTAVAVACLPVFFNGYTLKRWEGILFVAYYGAYTAYLVLGATESDSQGAFGDVMLWFVVPLTAITLGVIAYREWRAARSLPPVSGLRS